MKKHIILAVFTQVFTILERAVEGLYPPCCPFCDQILKGHEKEMGVCKTCQTKLVYITELHCLKCGKPIDNERSEYCYDCSRRRHNYDQARSVLSYQGITKLALYRFKFFNRREYAGYFAKEMSKMLEMWIHNCHADYLIPIPLSAKRERERGYNQARILAEAIGRITGIPCRNGLLVKHTDTQAQKELDARQRQKNLEVAFGIRDKEAAIQLSGKRVILVDDIYTTGATVDAAAAVLRQVNVSKVYVLTVAIGG